MPETWTIPKRKRKREPRSADEVRRLEIPDLDYSVAKLSPILRRTKSGFGREDYYGLVSSDADGGLATKVGRSSIPRALWLWNELIDRVVALGLALTEQSSISDGVESVSIELRELTASYRDPMKPRRRVLSSFGDDRPEREWAPTGVLQFRSEEVFGGGATHRWQETKGTRMEDRLDDVSVGLLALLKTKHERELERIRIAQEREEEARAWEARRRAEDHERARRRKLIRLSQSLEQAEMVRRLVAALQDREEGEAQEFLEWAKEVAHHIDPIRRIEAALAEGADPVEPDAEDIRYR